MAEPQRKAARPSLRQTICFRDGIAPSICTGFFWIRLKYRAVSVLLNRFITEHVPGVRDCCGGAVPMVEAGAGLA